MDKSQRGKDDVRRILGVSVEAVSNKVEGEIAWRLDRFLRDRPHVKLSAEQIEKAFAFALQRCPASYFNCERLDWENCPSPSEMMMESAVLEAVRAITVLTARTDSPKNRKWDQNPAI